jgi:hypothetical protein
LITPFGKRDSSQQRQSVWYTWLRPYETRSFGLFRFLLTRLSSLGDDEKSSC